MPFKSKEDYREYNRKRMQKQREGCTDKVAQIRVAQPKVAQTDRIDAIKLELDNPQLCKEIEAICIYFKDKRPHDSRLARFERALEYKVWRDNCKPFPSVSPVPTSDFPP